MFDINNTLNTMLSIDRDYYDKNQSTIENRTAKIMAMITDYYHNIFRSNLSPKEGLLRKHLGGARGNHGFRAVITSHEDVAHHDEIYIPWCVGVTVFRQHILNKLMNRNHRHGGLTHNQAVGLMMGHVYKYHPVLDAILKELIAEAPGRGIVCMIQRNPTLPQGSAQLVYIPKVKTDPNDQTVSISDLIATSMNA
jgi:DNA-directed RNA polymerase beta' subunit